MPDYTACVQRYCSWRSECARFRMQYGPLQSVSEFTPEGCTHHIPIAESPWPLVSLEAAAQRCVELRSDAPPQSK